jgi:myo-inositol-1(or 4)-monophosphatase
MYSESDFINHMEQAALLAGEYLHAYRDFSVQEKSDASFVTDLDLGVQDTITAYLSEHFPGISAITEEGGTQEIKREGYQWCIDPIDGTHNFIQGIGYYAFSIGLLKDGDPFLGVIYDPVRGELFTPRSHVQALPEKSFYTVVTGRGHGEISRKTEAKVIAQLLDTPAIKYRRFASAALDLAGISAGRIDGAVLIGNSMWDYVAGFGILQQKENIQITEYQPGIFIISRSEIHETLRTIIKDNL